MPASTSPPRSPAGYSEPARAACTGLSGRLPANSLQCTHHIHLRTRCGPAACHTTRTCKWRRLAAVPLRGCRQLAESEDSRPPRRGFEANNASVCSMLEFRPATGATKPGARAGAWARASKRPATLPQRLNRQPLLPRVVPATYFATRLHGRLCDFARRIRIRCVRRAASARCQKPCRTSLESPMPAGSRTACA